MEIRDKQNKKRGLLQVAILMMFIGFVSGCSQSGSDSGPSLAADTVSEPSSPGITELRMSKGVMNRTDCIEAWGNTRVVEDGGQVNCQAVAGKTPYKRVFFD